MTPLLFLVRLAARGQTRASEESGATDGGREPTLAARQLTVRVHAPWRLAAAGEAGGGAAGEAAREALGAALGAADDMKGWTREDMHSRQSLSWPSPNPLAA